MDEPNVQRAWLAYVDAENARVRDDAIAQLRLVIGMLHELPLAQRSAWALEIAESSIDKGMNTPIRMPLFREIIFPALLAGIHEQLPGCARWMAGFAQLLYKSPEAQDQLRPELRTELGLLRLAVENDPNDRLARDRLIECLAWQLDYSIHELPSGVLYGSDGASIEECNEMLTSVREFEHLVELNGGRPEYENLAATCRFHYLRYAEYLEPISKP